MTAVLMRLCPEDRERFPGGDEDGWVRFDEKDLDDLDLVTLNQFEADLNCTIEFLLIVDKASQSTRWTAARVWLARRMAGIKTPDLPEFNIKVRKVEIKDEPRPKRIKAKAVDVDPPSSSPSSQSEVSETASA